MKQKWSNLLRGLAELKYLNSFNKTVASQFLDLGFD